MPEDFFHPEDGVTELERVILDACDYPEYNAEGNNFYPNIYDQTFSGLADGMYREWVGLDAEEQTRPARLENWHPEDLAAFVGGEYVKNN